MTKKEKVKEDFLKDPCTVSLAKIRNFLLWEGFIEVDAGGSHFKIQGKDGRAFTVPLHHWDCLNVYKRKLKIFYLTYQEKDE